MTTLVGLTSVKLVLIVKNKLGSDQVPKFGRLVVKRECSASTTMKPSVSA